ncbi:SpoIIE family protein phosphatase [Nocardiopsis ansamitocini]|uniref:GAF domain-containing protein n=1 Tax=Nocardiopsis ansamitocini TaxID=1670832 RepID=A0A9W6PAW4_9ACTN|nr:SpoIIE family protein phosphatase [Nocardiopsis ansamitocini]GLU50214.1 hypothetical protein Nans01_45650 [Nocardiopsis ansamitocini]
MPQERRREEDGSAPFPDRGWVLAETGLSAASDPDMDRFARLVSSLLDAPIALVSLVTEDRQVFPGMIGLSEPWATLRATPLSHSLCQHVAADDQPLVLPDTRLDHRTCTNPAIDDLGVVAYAGMPLSDGNGRVLGTLCAIDTKARVWSRQQLRDLGDLAAACSADLRLRMASRSAQRARHSAEDAREAAGKAQALAIHSQILAERSAKREQALSEQARVALSRSELLLRAAEDLAGAASLIDVRRRVRDLVSGDLKPSYVGISLVEGQVLRRVGDPEVSYFVEDSHGVYTVQDGWPSARAAHERRMVLVPDRAALIEEYSAEAVVGFDSLGLATAVCVPLLGSRQVVGVMMLGWEMPYEIDTQERAVLTTIAGYAAQAVERALFVEERITVAHQLQEAMLTELPAHSGLELASLYRPAADNDMVGGDWYDAYHLPNTANGAEAPLAITVGDITGHDIHAATLMGQLRSMLRQADLDHPGQGPARAVEALEYACSALAVEASGSLVHAHLLPGPQGWSLNWTNAGHPPPLLAPHQGPVIRLELHDRLFFPGLESGTRTTHEHLLAPGSLLLLYTDGLVERRGHDIDTAIDHVAALLDALDHDSLPVLLKRLVERVAADRTDDDIVILAVRVPTTPPEQ